MWVWNKLVKVLSDYDYLRIVWSELLLYFDKSTPIEEITKIGMQKTEDTIDITIKEIILKMKNKIICEHMKTRVPCSMSTCDRSKKVPTS